VAIGANSLAKEENRKIHAGFCGFLLLEIYYLAAFTGGVGFAPRAAIAAS
jgi:hypothetical protein